jgi:hypothetical protein
VEADPSLSGGDPAVIGVGEAGDLREAALVLDVESGVAPAFLVRGEGPCSALLVAGVGGLPGGTEMGTRGGLALDDLAASHHNF